MIKIIIELRITEFEYSLNVLTDTLCSLALLVIEQSSVRVESIFCLEVLEIQQPLLIRLD